jgi:uncharacterized membrane protein YjjP (DUF1212 family)
LVVGLSPTQVFLYKREKSKHKPFLVTLAVFVTSPLLMSLKGNSASHSQIYFFVGMKIENVEVMLNSLISLKNFPIFQNSCVYFPSFEPANF